MKKYIDFDVNDIKETFHLEGGSLIRTSTGKDCTEQRDVRCGEYGKIYTNRVVFALIHGKQSIHPLLKDDAGSLVEVDDTIYALYTNRNFSKVIDYKNQQPRPFVAKWATHQGKRKSKSFKALDEAVSYQRMMMRAEWLDTLTELNLTKTILGEK